MKLAVEITSCTVDRAGVGYYAEHLVDALIATRRSADEVVLLGNRELAPQTAKKWGSRLHLSGAAIRYVWIQRDAPRLLRQTQADFAVFPNYLAPLASPCRYLNIVHDLALIRTPEFFDARKRMLVRPLLAAVARGAAAVGTVSQASQRDVVELLGIPLARAVVLPGAPHPACRPSSPARVAEVLARYGIKRPFVLTVGTLEPRKNLPTLLRAFDRLLAGSGAASEVDLVAVGGQGWKDRELRRELARRLPSGRVHLLGYVPEDDLVALYGAAAVFAYPSHFEGFGLPVVEAMACGTPVVASDVAALREVGGDAAVLVPPGDDVALAASLATLLEDPAARRTARARGLLRSSEFTWARTAEQLWALAEKLRPRPPLEVVPAALRAPGKNAPTGDAPHGSELESWAIAATVAYADLFNAAITTDDVAHSCLGVHLTGAEVARRAAAAPLAGIVTLTDGHLTLRGREHLVARRRDGVRRTADLLAERHGVLATLAALPFIRMLGLSGGTAHRNARGGDDLDLFVVTARQRIYTAYTMLFFASRLTRSWGIVCPNYLVDEDHLPVAYHHDLFTAHQAISLVPIAGQETFARFVRENDGWLRDFYPGFQARAPLLHLGVPWFQRAIERALRPSGDFIEGIVGMIWRVHLARKAARFPEADLVLSGGILKLHLADHRRRVLARFDERLNVLRSTLDAAGSTTPAANASGG